MISYLTKRLLLLGPTILVVLTVVFFLLRLIPGDPVDFVLGENSSSQARQTLIRDFELDQPLYVQYTSYLKNLLQGNWGRSFFSKTNVTDKITTRYLATMRLGLCAILWALLFAIPLGIGAALKKDKAFDKATLVGSLAGISIPTFYLGPLLVLLFSITLDLLPVSGQEKPGSIILPSLTLGLAMAALLTRITRASLLEVLQKDYLRTARAKGLSEKTVIFKHALRSALIPVIAILGLQLGTLLAGTIVTEKVFNWQGVGLLMLESIQQRDYALVQGCLLFIALTYVAVNLLTDLIYVLIDPRFRQLSES